MGSTGTCSFCGGRGHNRVSCAKRKEKVAIIRQEIEKGAPVGSWGYRLVAEDDRYSQRKNKPKKCSYCLGRYGMVSHNHNRGNCPRLAADRQKIIEMNRKLRIEALESMKGVGLGAGAVFNHPHWGKSLITDVAWNNFNPVSMGHLRFSNWQYDKSVFYFTPFSWLAVGNTQQKKARWDSRSIIDFQENVIVPISARAIMASKPDEWEKGETGIDFYFSRKSDKCV